MGKTILLLGATGFTGHLIARKLNENSIPFAAAGRSFEKLTLLKNEFHCITKTEFIDLDQTIDIIGSYNIVINCIGPFNLWGKKVLDFCIEHGKIYMDITGEQEFVKQSYENKVLIFSKGATIIHSVSFESCLVDLLVNEKIIPTETYHNISSYYYFQNSYPSPGTRLTIQLSKFFPHYRLENSELIQTETVEYQEKVSFPGLPECPIAVFMPYPEVVFFYERSNIKNGASFFLMSEIEARYLKSMANEAQTTVESVLDKHYKSKMKLPSEATLSRFSFIIFVKMTTVQGRVNTYLLSGTNSYDITANNIVSLVRRINGGALLPKGIISPYEAFGGEWNWNGINLREII